MAKRTTAISKYNVIATFQSGKAGNVRLYKKGDRTYMRAAYNGALNNPRSDAQMKNRLMWGSVSHAWAALRDFLQKSFEGSTPYRSTNNLFMQANKLAGVGIYLTKEQNIKRMCKCMPYVVSSGSLTPIETKIVQSDAISDLIVSTGFVGTTVKELTESLLTENSGVLMLGDRITLLRVDEEQVSAMGAVPFLRARAFSFVLDLTDSTAFATLGFGVSSSSHLSVAGSYPPNKKVGCAFILSRRTDNGLLISDATLNCSDMCDYDKYLTDNAFYAAKESYGKSEQVYLDPRANEEE